MKLIILAVVLVVMVACGTSSNKAYELTGRFEIKELRCDGGVQPISSRIMEFTPDSGQKSIKISYIHSSGDPQFKQMQLTGSYNIQDRSFTVDTSYSYTESISSPVPVQAQTPQQTGQQVPQQQIPQQTLTIDCSVMIEGSFQDKSYFQGTWTERCKNAQGQTQVRCEIDGIKQ